MVRLSQSIPSEIPTTAALRLRKYEQLINISRDLASTLNIDALLKRISRVAAEMSEAEAASILLYDEGNRKLFFKNATNFDERQMSGVSVPLEGSIAGWVVTNRQPLIITDVHKDPRFFSKIEKTTNFLTSSMIAVPLIHKDRVLGVLEVLNKTSGVFDQDDLNILMVLSAQAAVAIENTRLFQQSDLISELVHELRTPLAALDTAAYLLQRNDLPDEQRTKVIQAINSETQRLNDLATSFLDLARLESGQAIFEPSSFDLEPLIEECVSLMQYKADGKQVHISAEVAPLLPPMNADRDKIKQVFINLLSNAIKYNQPGGFVFIRAGMQDGELVITVSDTGIGVPPEDLPHIFERFYRAKGIEQIANGTGLGLSICKHIIENHGGRIEAQSRPGEGTQITAHLPLR